MKKSGTQNNSHQCSSCGETYRKQDFTVCPFCAGDGGGILTKTWKPNKHQRKEWAKQNKNNLK